MPCKLTKFLPPANEVCEGYVFTRVCHSVHGGESTWAGTPLGPGTPPGTRYTPRAVHAGRYGQQAGGTHPTAMHSCSRMHLRNTLHLKM